MDLALLKYHLDHINDLNYIASPDFPVSHRWQSATVGRLLVDSTSSSPTLKAAGHLAPVDRQMFPFGNYNPKFDSKLVNASQSFSITALNTSSYYGAFKLGFENIDAMRAKVVKSGPRKGVLKTDCGDMYINFRSKCFSVNNPFEERPAEADSAAGHAVDWYSVGKKTNVCAAVSKEEWDKALESHHPTPMPVYDGEEFWNPSLLPSKFKNVAVEVIFTMRHFVFRDREVSTAYVQRVNILQPVMATMEIEWIKSQFEILMKKRSIVEGSVPPAKKPKIAAIESAKEDPKITACSEPRPAVVAVNEPSLGLSKGPADPEVMGPNDDASEFVSRRGVSSKKAGKQKVPASKATRSSALEIESEKRGEEEVE